MLRSFRSMVSNAVIVTNAIAGPRKLNELSIDLLIKRNTARPVPWSEHWLALIDEFLVN